jgi:hypothetical protein
MCTTIGSTWRSSSALPHLTGHIKELKDFRQENRKAIDHPVRMTNDL